MKAFKRFIDSFNKKPEKIESDLKCLEDYVIYSGPSDKSPLMQRGRQQLIVKIGEKEILAHEIFVYHPPFLIKEPIPSRTLSGLSEAWRLAFDKKNERVYCTNNAGQGSGSSYSVLQPFNDDKRLLKTVQCDHIWNIRGIAVDDSGNIFVSGDHKVQKYNEDDELVASLGWKEPGSECYQFNDPNGVCWMNDCVYVCDSRNKRIQVLSNDLEYINSIDNGSYLQHPEDLDFDKKGNMYVIDSGNKSVITFDQDNNHVQSIKLPEQEIDFPVSIRIFAGNFYVSDLGKSHIVVVSPNGEFLHKISIRSLEEEGTDGFESSESSVSQRPVGLAVDSDGYVYVSNIDGKEIQVF